MNIWYEVFQKVVNMSITGIVVILGILLIRTLLCKAPKKFSYMLWGIVLFRLLCPMSLSFAFSVLNLADAAITDNGEVVYISPNFVFRGKDFGNQSMEVESEKEDLSVTKEREAVSATDEKEIVQLVPIADEKVNLQFVSSVEENAGTPLNLGIRQMDSTFLGIPFFMSNTIFPEGIIWRESWLFWLYACIGSIHLCGWHSCYLERIWK